MFSNIIWITNIHTNVLHALSQLRHCIYFHLSIPLYDHFRLKSIVKLRNNKSVSVLLCSTHWDFEDVTHKFGFNMAPSVEIKHDFRAHTNDTSSGRTVALGSTQCLIEMSTRAFSGE